MSNLNSSTPDDSPAPYSVVLTSGVWDPCCLMDTERMCDAAISVDALKSMLFGAVAFQVETTELRPLVSVTTSSYSPRYVPARVVVYAQCQSNFVPQLFGSI